MFIGKYKNFFTSGATLIKTLFYGLSFTDKKKPRLELRCSLLLYTVYVYTGHVSALSGGHAASLSLIESQAGERRLYHTKISFSKCNVTKVSFENKMPCVN